MLGLLVSATPVLADDPIEVGIVIGTGGDANVNVEVNAGGDSNVIVDGVDLKETAAVAQDAYDTVHSLPVRHAMEEWQYYWTKTKLGSRVDSQIAELQAISSLLSSAEVKLIQENGNRVSDIATLATRISDVSTSLQEASDAAIAINNEQEATIADLEAQMVLFATELGSYEFRTNGEIGRVWVWFYVADGIICLMLVILAILVIRMGRLDSKV
jgi:hypothetical protein